MNLIDEPTYLADEPIYLGGVDRYTGDNFVVDTTKVSDSAEPYETGIKHPAYNENAWVIVEMYNTIQEAEKGHKKWIKTMTKPNLPKQLEDVSTSFIAALTGGDKVYRREEI